MAITVKEIMLRHDAYPDATEKLIKMYGLKMYQQAIQDVLGNAQKFDIQGNQVLLVVEGTYFRKMQNGNTFCVVEELE